MNSGSYLLDEIPLTFYRSLAVVLGGVDKAVILQEIHLLLNAKKTAQDKYTLIDGCWWVYNSYDQWRARFFPWLSVPTLQRHFAELEDLRIVVSRQGVKNPLDRKKWYTIDYPAWERFAAEAQLADYAESHGASYQNDTMGEPADHINLIRSKASKRYDDSSVWSLSVVSLQGFPRLSDAGAPTKPAAAKKPNPNEPLHDALVKAFGLEPKDMTRSADTSFWSATAELAKIGVAAEDIPALHKFVAEKAKAEQWHGFGVFAISKHAPAYLAQRRSESADPEKPLDPKYRPENFVPIKAPPLPTRRPR